MVVQAAPRKKPWTWDKTWMGDIDIDIDKDDDSASNINERNLYAGMTVTLATARATSMQ